MPVTNYHTVDGEIQGQTTAGVRTDYLTDALGSVVATVNSSAQVINTYRYKPYGERLAKTGAGADPRFLWVGTPGYRVTSRSHSSHYVRVRTYAEQEGGWTTVDVFWPFEPAYVYVNATPTSEIDPSGTGWKVYIECSGSYKVPGGTRTDKQDVIDALNEICASRKLKEVDECMDDKCPDKPASANRNSCFKDFCAGTSPIITIKCVGRGGGDCASNTSRDCAQTSGLRIDLCGSSLGSKGSPAPSKKCRPLRCVLMHEIIHTCGFSEPGNFGKGYINANEACHCFNCTAMAFPECDGYYVDPRTGKRTKDKDCEQSCLQVLR